MQVAAFCVVLDANALFPLHLRDTLLRCAEAGLIQIYWSAEILGEVARNLPLRTNMSPAQATTMVACMRAAFPEALVTNYEALTAAMKNHEKDRHVAAVAVKIGAEVIVTANLKDFMNLPDGLEAVAPDAFLLNLVDMYPAELLTILHEQVGDYEREPLTVPALLDRLAKCAPEFAGRARQLLF